MRCAEGSSYTSTRIASTSQVGRKLWRRQLCHVGAETLSCFSILVLEPLREDQGFQVFLVLILYLLLQIKQKVLGCAKLVFVVTTFGMLCCSLLDCA